ncbi:MAG TPA: hypothetical protein VGX76_13355 [Pirellulales bacterium]|jgi:hypothetical protein|nr:hypothetical protein [Pirellulales bacterium]
MKRLIITLVVLVVGVAALGYFEGWYQASTRQNDHKAELNISIDKDKIHDDAQRAKQAAENAGKELIDKSKEGVHRLGRELERTGVDDRQPPDSSDHHDDQHEDK